MYPIVRRARLLLRHAVQRIEPYYQKRYLRQKKAEYIDFDVAKFPYMGYGASIAWVQAAYIACDTLSAKLVVRNTDKWPYGGALAECSFDRFIEFPGAIVNPAEPQPGSLPYEVGNWQNLRYWGVFDSISSRTCQFGYKPRKFAAIEDYRRSMMARTYRLTEYSQSFVSRQTGFLPPRYLAWHLRRGDKTTGRWREDNPVPLERYVQATGKLYERDPAMPRRILICTDSDAALEEAQGAIATFDSGIEVLHDPNERRWDGYCELHRNGQIVDPADMLMEILTAQKLIEMMRHATGLVGCNSSYLFRIASLLHAGADNVVSLSENRRLRRYFPA